MPVHIGADDLVLFENPQPELLHRVTGLTPEPGGLHVRLDGIGVRSTQRLALSGHGPGYVASIWPAELKEQAVYLYGRRLSTPMIGRARELGWRVEPALQLAFRSSGPLHRLYVRPDVDALAYAAVWEDDLSLVGQHTHGELRGRAWPWLKSLGWVADRDDATLDRWMSRQLGRRPAFLRPGLRFRVQLPDVSGLRADVDAILRSADEPPLPG